MLVVAKSAWNFPFWLKVSQFPRISSTTFSLGIALLDHIIVGRSNYFSFIEHGLLELPAAD
jgi:hypothetical protein